MDAPNSVTPDSNTQLQAIALLAPQNDVKRARAEIEKLSPDLKSRLQPWLDRVYARDTALQTVTAFSSSALSAMSKAD